jgi:uncharacterized protein YoaH (UPF0181 family)
MPSSTEHFDQFFREQLHQLRSKGHSSEEAADILLQAQRAILEACQKLLERTENGEPVPDNESGQAQS